MHVVSVPDRLSLFTIREGCLAKKKASTKAAKTAARPVAVKEAFTKSELLTSIADNTGLSRFVVGNVLDELSNAIARHIKPKGPGVFLLFGLFKIKTIKKKATKARFGFNPYTEVVSFF